MPKIINKEMYLSKIEEVLELKFLSETNIFMINIKNLFKKNKKGKITPEYILEKLIKQKIQNVSHIHIYFKNISDHIVVLFNKGEIKGIIAKTEECEKGKYVEWESSVFSKYHPQNVLNELGKRIDRIEIDESGYKKIWTYKEFLKDL